MKGHMAASNRVRASGRKDRGADVRQAAGEVDVIICDDSLETPTSPTSLLDSVLTCSLGTASKWPTLSLPVWPVPPFDREPFKSPLSPQHGVSDGALCEDFHGLGAHQGCGLWGHILRPLDLSHSTSKWTPQTPRVGHQDH